MSVWCCCWQWLQRPRPLSATEILVAASVNTAVKRISSNSDDSLDNISLHYNTFVVPPHKIPACTPCRPHGDITQKQRDDRSQFEMVALVRPLQRHQDHSRSRPKLNERDTLLMDSLDHSHNGYRSSTSDYDTQSITTYHSDYGDDISCHSGHVVRMSGLDDDDCYDPGSAETGSPENPVDECFGSVVVCTRKLSHRIVGVLVLQLRGLPWVGANEGLSVELRALGAAKTHWFFLPNAKGPEVIVQREVTVKLPRPPHKEQGDSRFNSPWYPSSMAEQHGTGEAVLLTVWPGCGSHNRHTAIGHAIVAVVDHNATPRVLGLYGHTKVHGELGSLEVSLTSSSTSSSTTSRNRGVLVKILRTHGLQKPTFHWIAKKAAKTLPDRERLDVWCSITLWISGEKIKKEVTPKMPMPPTGDPMFKSSCTFFIPKPDQHKACLVIKVHCGRRLHEVTVGRVMLGPLLYLGCYRHPPLMPMDTSSPRPVTLSHWGQAFNTHYPITQWHRLRH